MPGTYAGNRLKKFVEQEGFYEATGPDQRNPEEDPEEEENEREIGDTEENRKEIEKHIEKGVALDSEEANENPEYLPMNFEILLPELGEDQREKYAQYKE